MTSFERGVLQVTLYAGREPLSRHRSRASANFFDVVSINH